MKYILFTSLLLCGVVGTLKHDINGAYNLEEGSNLYRVTSIDSTELYYYVYATQKGMKYKIVSLRKDDVNGEGCNRIAINKCYDFNLDSLFDRGIIIGEDTVSFDSNIVGCVSYELGGWVCRDRANGIYDVYEALNLKGLCFKEGLVD